MPVNIQEPEHNVQESHDRAHATTTFSVDFDIGRWPINISDSNKNFWIKNGVNDLQNSNNDILKQKSFVQIDNDNKRRCKLSMFERKLKNGEILKRSWLCFSPSVGKLFCVYCKLFSDMSSNFTRDGYGDWKNASRRLEEHEKSMDHIKAVRNFTTRSKTVDVIDLNLEKQRLTCKEYWIKVLKRVVSVLKVLIERDLSLRGDNEIIGSAYNGNFLKLIELIAEYDDFLQCHLKKYGQCGSGHVNYLSSTTYEELIKVMNEKVVNRIVSDLNEAKYFSISIDSTTDAAHNDQLVLTVRYVYKGEPIERFLGMMSNKGHKAEQMFNAVQEFLDSHNINIKNCRGQSHDNASVMSGTYGGFQKLLRNVSPLAFYIPCFTHSLNLVGTDVMTCCLEAKKFFDFLENIYVFFTSSSDRFSNLQERFTSSLKSVRNRIINPKRVSTTRWSSRADAVKSLITHYDEYREILFELSDENDQARGLYQMMIRLETGIYVHFWNDILQKMNNTSLKLQSPETDLNTSLALLKSLQVAIGGKRNDFNHYENLGKYISGASEYSLVDKRNRKINVRLSSPGKKSNEASFSNPAQKFRVDNYLPIIDKLQNSLEDRIAAYDNVNSYFGFLRKLYDLSNSEIQDCSKKLVDLYDEDLENNLGNELIQFREFAKEFDENVSKKKDPELSFETKLYKLLNENNLQEVFPNVNITLLIYLTLMTTNCTSERAFSKLKLLQGKLRVCMKQDRLTCLMAMSLEGDLLREMSFDSIIDSFAEKKSRKML